MRIRTPSALALLLSASLSAIAHDCPPTYPAANADGWLSLSAGMAAQAREAKARELQRAAPAPVGKPAFTAAAAGEARAPAGDLFQLDLEQLMDLEVTLASKRLERGSGAAASISAYSRSFLDQHGIANLGDLAELTPGYSTYSMYGERVFETRGQKAPSYDNNRHLLLIDGIPVRHSRNNKVFIEQDLPLQFADRVEMLRGPASALYGSGAMFGVVSITPRIATAGTQVDSRMGLGNQGIRQANATISHGGDAADSLLSAGYFRKADSLAFNGIKDEAANRYRDGRMATFFYASHKLKEGPLQGLGLGAIYSYKSGNLGEVWNWGDYTNQINNLTWGTFIPYIKYERDLTEALRFSGYFKMNESFEKGVADQFNTQADLANYKDSGNLVGIFDIHTRNYEVQAELQWQASPDFDLIAGVNVGASQLTGDYDTKVVGGPEGPFASVPVPKTGLYRTSAVYAQARKQYEVLAGLSVVAGLRFDRGGTPSDGYAYSQLSPRLGLVQRLTPRTALKLLYGTALYAPGIKEFETNNTYAISGAPPGYKPPQLSAERFKTLELAASYTDTSISGTITGFTNRSSNLFSSIGGYSNLPGVQRASGLEAEMRYSLTKHLQGWVNASFARARTPADKSVDDVPGITGSMGISSRFVLGQPMQASAVLRHVGNFRVADPAQPKPPGGTMLDLRLAAWLTPGLNLSLDLRNVTDKTFKFPKAGRPDVPSPGRMVQFNANAAFD